MLRHSALLGFLASSLAFCAVTAVRVSERSDVLDGETSGKAGPYERIIATVHYAVDPKLPANAIIRDIQYAPTNDAGLVEFTADLYVLKPRDPARGNGAVLLEINNRGGKAMLNRFQYGAATTDPRTAADFGDRLLMERGFTLVWVGWQFDVPSKNGRMALHAPVITDHGKTITGRVRSEFVPDRRVTSFNLGDRDHISYEAADANDPANVLTVRPTRDTARKTIPRSAWQFDGAGGVTMAAGFEPGLIYEVVYTAKNPTVVGLGPAAVRDFISYVKYGTPASGINVLGDEPRFLKYALGFGISQSGRFLRKFLYDGFNADEKGRRVFDGMWADVAGAGRGSFNHRFAQPSRDAQPFANFFYPTDVFPFTDLDETDGGVTDGLLDHVRQMPKIFYTNGSYEYWGRAASLIHTTPDGLHDAPPAPQTRIYFIAGAQHGPGAWPPTAGDRRYMGNPNDQRPLERALLMRLLEWVKESKEPPPSQIPLLAKQQLVSPAKLSFPVPGVAPPKHYVEAFRIDFGPDFEKSGIVTKEPAALGKPYPTLVPQVDASGNEIAGVHMPEVRVPLGTYTGWNFRAASLGAPEQSYAFAGSWFPFARTKAERERAKDRRPSIAERYANREEYLAKVGAAARELAGQGFLLEVDVPRILERSGKEWDYVMSK